MTTLLLLLAVVITFIFLVITNMPLGIVGEWFWLRTTWHAESFNVELTNILLAVVAGVGYITYAVWGLKHFSQSDNHQPVRWLIGLVVAGFCWLLMLQDAPPLEHRLSKVPIVLYDPASSGYFYTVRYEIDHDFSHFLTTYDKRMAKGDVLHEGTHPPGLYVMHKLCLSVCENFPLLTKLLLLSTESSLEAGGAFHMLQTEGNIAPEPLTETDMAAIWLAGMLTQFLAVASVVPLFFLVRRFFDDPLVWKVVVFWMFVPALAIFLPKSDALYPFFGMTILCLWFYGLDRQSWWLSLSAGLLFWVGLFFSLAILPVGLLAFLLTMWEWWFVKECRSTECSTDQNRHLTYRQILKAIGFATIGFMGMILLVWLVWDLNLINVWLWNYKNHAAFYSQHSRTAWKWLVVNPIELVFAVGLPLFFAVVLGMINQLRNYTKLWLKSKGLLFCSLIVWGLLWLSGKNNGEAARLWLVLEIWGVWLLCYSPLLQESKLGNKEENKMRSTIVANKQWVILLVCQLIACLITVTSVTGFRYMKVYKPHNPETPAISYNRSSVKN